MQITAIKTHKISPNEDLFGILDKYLPKLANKTVVAVTSKIVAICEGRVVPIEISDKDQLIEKEAQYFLPREENPYHVSLTITHNMLAASAGIDESNGNGQYILWPKDLQKSANSIREYLVKKHKLKQVGVILTDSKTTPMRWGVTGICLAYSGFIPLHDLIGMPDLFGKPLEFTKVSVIDCLASAAILEMGETNEKTPLTILTNIKQIKFVSHNPTQKELESIKITMDKDLYGQFLKKANWKKGKSSI